MVPDYRYSVPLVAAAVCPHPPLIVPEIAAGAAPELDGLRTACDTAVAHLRAATPDRLVVLGSGPEPGPVAGPVRASFASWGVPVGLGEGVDLPLALAVGAWLLGSTDEASFVVAGEAGLPLGDESVALLVMGDGSACRGVRSPGYTDPRAEPFDDGVARALATVDTAALLALDAVVADELRVAGRTPWQVLARAVAASGRRWQGEVLYYDAPYGVAYFVAVWEPACG